MNVSLKSVCFINLRLNMKDLHLFVFGTILQVSHILWWNALPKFYLYGLLSIISEA